MQTQKLMEFAVERHLSGDLDAASEVYCNVLREQPDFADAWNLSGVVAYQMGRHDDGIEYISHAISLREDVPEYYVNLATALMAQKRVEQAELCSRKCLELDPDHQLAWNVLGNALCDQGKVSDAIKCFRRALDLNEQHLDAWVNLGRLYRETNALELAEECVSRALAINAGHPIALSNLGAIRHAQGHNEEALPLFEQALQHQPNSPQILVNMGNTLQDLGRYHDAGNAFQTAVEVAPSHANAWNSLGYYYEQLAQTTSAIDCYRQAITLDPKHVAATSNYLFALNLADVGRRECYDEHVALSGSSKASQTIDFPNNRNPARKLRVGYLSPDFRRHPLVSFFEPMLEAHASDEFDVFCYANVKKADEVTARIQNKAPHWLSVYGMTDDDVVAAITSDQIDILVDLAGHTADNRLSVFARRAAPVQVSMLGYLNTTGLATMDYFVSDEVRDPQSEDEFYTEEVVRLNDGGCCWAPPEHSPDVQTPPLLTRGYATFGSMHRPNKLTDRTLQLWARIINAVPNSRLLIFHNMLKKSDELQGHLLRRCQTAGIEHERIDLAWDDANEYLTAYQEMDILLETTPWSSGTTALESMWCGVPIPTMLGKSPCGRATASALHRLRLHELVGVDETDYSRIVAELAADSQRLDALRGNLREKMRSTICDAASFVGQLEASYRDMWRRVCHVE